MKALSSGMLLAAFVSTAAVAQQGKVDTSSGNNMLPSCKMAIDGQGPMDVWAAHCSGVIAALTYVSPALSDDERFCPPQGYSVLQARRIVVRYMETHPEDLHTNYIVLALRALQRAWPCHGSGAGGSPGKR